MLFRSLLIYETFAEGNETVGKPSRPEFLLRPGELLDLCKDLRVVAFEDGFWTDSNGGNPQFVQRIAAVRALSPQPEPSGPVQYLLT